MSEVVRFDVFRGYDAARELIAGSFVAFGAFDGAHRGHRFLIGRARETANDSGGFCIAVVVLPFNQAFAALSPADFLDAHKRPDSARRVRGGGEQQGEGASSKPPVTLPSLMVRQNQRAIDCKRLGQIAKCVSK